MLIRKWNLLSQINPTANVALIKKTFTALKPVQKSIANQFKVGLGKSKNVEKILNYITLHHASQSQHFSFALHSILVRPPDVMIAHQTNNVVHETIAIPVRFPRKRVTNCISNFHSSFNPQKSQLYRIKINLLKIISKTFQSLWNFRTKALPQK